MIANDVLTGIKNDFLDSVDHADIVYNIYNSWSTDKTKTATIVTADTGIDSDGNIVVALTVDLWSENMHKLLIKKVNLYDENDAVLASKDESITMTIGLLESALAYRFVISVTETGATNGSGVSF